MNEHNNGCMMLACYAVWTSDVNANDKPDLRRCSSSSASAGPTTRCARDGASPGPTWPMALPGFREALLAHTDAMDALGRQPLRLCAPALDLPPDIRPREPAENAFIEAFNGRLRDECLNVHQFASIMDAQAKIEAWRGRLKSTPAT
jgi:transposase InsO family protein